MDGPPLDSYLDPSERVLWSGQPKQGLRLQASDAMMIPFSLMWGGFAIFWEASALGLVAAHRNFPPSDPGQIVSWIFPLWCVPFVVVGLYMIFGRFFYDAALRRKTWYAVTDQRLIILKSLFSSSVTSFDYGQLSGLNLTERGDRSGDITFGAPLMVGDYNTRTNRRTIVPGFYLLPDARRIYDLIRGAQQAAKK